MKIRAALAALAISGLLIGCGKEDAGAADEAAPEATAATNILDGPIPGCEKLISLEDAHMVAYRAAAYRECANARTMQEKMENVGCMVRHEITTKCGMSMKGSVRSALADERKAVLGE